MNCADILFDPAGRFFQVIPVGTCLTDPMAFHRLGTLTVRAIGGYQFVSA